MMLHWIFTGGLLGTLILGLSWNAGNIGTDTVIASSLLILAAVASLAGDMLDTLLKLTAVCLDGIKEDTENISRRLDEASYSPSDWEGLEE